MPLKRQLPLIGHRRQVNVHCRLCIDFITDLSQQRLQLIHRIQRRIFKMILDQRAPGDHDHLAEVDRVAVFHIQRPQHLVCSAIGAV